MLVSSPLKSSLIGITAGLAFGMILIGCSTMKREVKREGSRAPAGIVDLSQPEPDAALFSANPEWKAFSFRTGDYLSDTKLGITRLTSDRPSEVVLKQDSLPYVLHAIAYPPDGGGTLKFSLIIHQLGSAPPDRYMSGTDLRLGARSRTIFVEKADIVQTSSVDARWGEIARIVANAAAALARTPTGVGEDRALFSEASLKPPIERIVRAIYSDE